MIFYRNPVQFVFIFIIYETLCLKQKMDISIRNGKPQRLVNKFSVCEESSLNNIYWYLLKEV